MMTFALFLLQIMPPLPTDANEVRPADTPPPASVPADMPESTPRDVRAQTVEEARLAACMQTLREDPTSAIAEASRWAAQETGAGRAYPLQCLGTAYMWMNRHAAAADAFTEARDLALPSQNYERARYGAMAAIALEAAGDMTAAASASAAAETDALATGDAILGAAIARDAAGPLAQIGRAADAEAALERARKGNPQDPQVWLISARLARSQERLADAQMHIQTAAALSPRDPEVGLEAGIIAALAGRDGAARMSFNSVIEIAPGSELAARARDYLGQLPAAEGR